MSVLFSSEKPKHFRDVMPSESQCYALYLSVLGG